MTSMMLHLIAFLCVLTLQSLQATAGVLHDNQSMILADVLVRSPCHLFACIIITKNDSKSLRNARFVLLDL